MKRTLSLSTESTDESKGVVNINEISSIVNHSTDIVFCDILENISESNLPGFMTELFNKIKPGGYIVFKILDVKKICAEFLQNKIPNTDFAKIFKLKENVVMLDLIYTFIDSNVFNVTKLDQEQSHITLTVQRVSL